MGMFVDRRMRDVAVDVLMLWQGNAQSVPLLTDAMGTTAIDAGGMSTLLSAGPRVSLIRVVDQCHAIEGNYFQVRPFNATLQAQGLGGPYALVNAGDLTFADIESATATSGAMIQSAEMNWRTTHCGSPITWLAGPAVGQCGRVATQRRGQGRAVLQYRLPEVVSGLHHLDR